MMIAASIVAYHTPSGELSHLLECVMKSSIDILYLIDNSTNDSLRELERPYSKVIYIHSLNMGFGHGHNIAIKKAIELGAQYHVVINPDIYWNDHVIETLSNYMTVNQECGLVMPQILYPNGNIQHLCKLLPTPMNLLGRRFLPFKSLVSKMDERYEMRFTNYDKEMEVPSLSGCFMFLRVDVLMKVGMFVESFFMFAEDLVLCRRIGEVSKTMYYPAVSVIHEYGKGSYKNKKLLKYHICSVIKYFNKWGWIFDTKRSLRNKECLEKLINK